ncbi:MAG: ion transporter [Armatimonadetes bacterium]|nr:ion transporter [Armatimonadota bacterium]
MNVDVRKRTWEIVEVATPGDKSSRLFDICILTLIVLNVAAVIIGSVEAVRLRCEQFLYWFEVFSVVVFTGEYLARLWSCVSDPRFSHPFSGRVRFAFTFMALVDLVAILPFYLPFAGLDLRFVRALRLFRIVRIAKVGRYYSSLRLIRNVLKSKKEELVLTTALMVLLLLIASSLMYYAESSAQPDQFPNIPASMWWAVSTLTTVGYGDVCPVTIAGKTLAALISILGIGMFALPTGILGAGFVEEIQRQKTGPTRCPHCGKSME